MATPMAGYHICNPIDLSQLSDNHIQDRRRRFVMHPTLLRVSRPFYTWAELGQLQRRAGLEGTAGTAKLVQGFQMMSTVCRSLQVPMRTLATAMVLYQRSLVFAGVSESATFPFLAICIILALKLEDTPKKLPETLQAILRVRMPSPSQAEIDSLRHRALELEPQVLDATTFDLRFRHPHPYVIKLAKEIGLDREVASTAWNIVTDMYCTFIPLVEPAHTMALAALRVSSKLHLKDWGDFDTLTLGTRRGVVRDTAIDILNFYVTSYADSVLSRSAPPRTSLAVIADILAELRRDPGVFSGPRDDLPMEDYKKDMLGDTATTRYVLELDGEYLAGELPDSVLAQLKSGQSSVPRTAVRR